VVSCSAFDRTGGAQRLQKVIQCLSFQVLLGYSLMSLWESFIFPQVLMNFLSSELNILPYSILLRYYYARSNSMKSTLQCDAIMTSSVREITTL